MKKRSFVVCLLAGALALGPVGTVFGQAEETKSDFAVPAGGPLSESEIIILLQAKVQLDVIQSFVTKRGVNFVSTKETGRRIITAGGNVSLVGTVNLNQKDEVLTAVADNGKKKSK